MKLEEKQLPNGWEVKKLGEVCLTTSGGTPSRGNKEFYEGNIPWVKSGELDKGLILDTEEKISEEAIKNSSAKIFPKGTLLIALYGATIGKLAFLGIDAASNQAVCGIFKSDKINSNYLFNFLFYKKSTLVKQSIGGAQPNISQGILKNLEIPLPPLSEQQEIVAKIEELFSQLENGKKELLTAQAKLKTYRQSLLKSAFEGRLTNENLKDGELPEGWEVKKLGEVCKTSSGGTPSRKNPSFYQGNIPWVKSGELDRGIIIETEEKISEEAVKNSSAKIFPKGTLLIAIYGATVGKLSTLGIDATTNQAVCGIFKSDKIELDFLQYFLLNKKQFLINQSIGAAQPNISQEILKNLDIPVPPLAQQQQIVAILESKLAACDQTEETIKTSLNNCEILRQSILKKAFEGRLVNQNFTNLSSQ